MDPNQDSLSDPDLGPNYLQRVSLDDKSSLAGKDLTNTSCRQVVWSLDPYETTGFSSLFTILAFRIYHNSRQCCRQHLW